MNYIIEAYDRSGAMVQAWELGDSALSLRVEQGTIQAVAYSYAELTIEQRDGVRVTNVSGARIYLRELLQKEQEAKWNVGEDLGFWDYTLRLKKKDDESRVAVRLTPTNLTLRPGESAKCEVELRHTGREDLRVGLKVTNFPENWVQCEPRRVRLNEAQRTAHLTLTISVPKTARQESEHSVTVSAIDEQHKRELGDEFADWRVIPVSRLEILPTVRRRRFRAGYKISLRNARSRTLECILTGQCETDELNELELVFAKEREKNLVNVPLELKPGEEKTVHLKIKSPAKWTGGDRRHNFSLLAQPDEQAADDAAETIIANGEFIHRQVITLVEGIIVCGLLVLLGVFSHFAFRPKLEVTIQPSGLANPRSPVTVSWHAPRATQVRIVEPIEIPLRGEVGSHTFDGFDANAVIPVTVVASNFFGSRTIKMTLRVRDRIIDVPGKEPRIKSFKASPGNVEIGAKTRLSWTAENVIGCEVREVEANLKASDSIEHQPEQTREYELVCTGQSDKPASKKITVKVLPKINSFDIPEWKDVKNQKSFRPGDPITVQWAVTVGQSPQPPTFALRVNNKVKQLGGPSGEETFCLGLSQNATVQLVVTSDGIETKSRPRTVRFNECSGLEKICKPIPIIKCPKCNCPQK